jgi:16S rRNA (uracil1498-N3)-methyltransferase
VNARFYAPSAHEVGSELALPEDEAQHLSRVLRLKAGDSLVVFDGKGGEFAASVSTLGKSGVIVRLDARLASRPELPVALTLAQAVLKGDKMDDVVRDAVMLGFAAVQPIVTARSDVSLATLTRGARHERWHRVAVSSAKQCGRAVVPVVAPPIAFEGPASLAHLPSPQFLLVEPGASPDTQAVSALDSTAPAAATIIVGPEGGWTADELRQCHGHAHPVGIGPLTLRADAAAMVAASALLTHWKQL